MSCIAGGNVHSEIVVGGSKDRFTSICCDMHMHAYTFAPHHISLSFCYIPYNYRNISLSII